MTQQPFRYFISIIIFFFASTKSAKLDSHRIHKQRLKIFFIFQFPKHRTENYFVVVTLLVASKILTSLLPVISLMVHHLSRRSKYIFSIIISLFNINLFSFIYCKHRTPGFLLMIINDLTSLF